MTLVNESIRLYADSGFTDALYDQILAAYEYEMCNALNQINANLQRLFPHLEVEVQREDK